MDLAVERALREALEARVPGVVVIGEEGGREGSGALAEGALVVFVDPVDGTTNFAHGHPFYATSIGFARDGVPVAGAVVAPSLDLAYSASASGPAWRNEERCTVTAVAALEEALLATGFPYDRRTSDDDNLRAFGAFKKRAQGIRRCGSAALDLCLVADGTYDAYWERKLMPWDVAAGILIASRAGALITTDVGEPFLLKEERLHLLASGPALQPAMLEVLRKLAPKTP